MSAGDAETLTAAPSGVDAPLGPGRSLGRYTIDRVLGQGGMGVVYAAHDPDLDRTVALKLLRGPGDDFARARLLREARAMAKLAHPNVITVFEVDTVGDRDFVAMELVEGSSVDAWLRSQRSLADILDVFVRAGRGLAAAHDKGLVHRDFKPHNVLVGRDGKVVVTDFGLARAAGAESVAVPATLPATPIRGDEETLAPTPGAVSAAATPSSKPSWSTTITATGALLGTPAYMAPEQWQGANADPRSDQFAYSVSLWEAVGGARPFRGDDLATLRAAAAAGPPPAPKGMPAWLVAILRRGLAVEPAARWPSMTALVDAIEHGRGRGRRRAITAGVAVVLLVGGGATAVAVGRGGDSSSRAASVAAGAAGAPVDSVCQPIDAAIAELWSPERAAKNRERLKDAPALAAHLDRYFGELTTRWRTAYERACNDRSDRQRLTRVACLETWRETMIGNLDGFELVPAETTAFVPFPELIRPLEPCLGTSPVMPPIAQTPEQRAVLRVLRAENTVLAFTNDTYDDQRWLAQRAKVEATGYAPAVVELDIIRASLTEGLARDLVAARPMFEQVAVDAEVVSDQLLRAEARVAIASFDITEKRPDATIDASLKAARAAIAAAGSPPLLVNKIDELQAERAIHDGDHDRAIDLLAALQPRYIELNATRRVAKVTGERAQLLHARNRPGDRERALEILRVEAERERAELGDQAFSATYLDEVRQELAAAPATGRALR